MNKILDFLKRFKDKKFQQGKERAVADLTNFLVTRFGFGLEEAFKASIDFWKKHEYKLKEIL